MQTVKVKVEGQYYWQDGRTKQLSAFETEVDVPVDKLGGDIQGYIQRNIITAKLRKLNPKATDFRVCALSKDKNGMVPDYANMFNNIELLEESDFAEDDLDIAQDLKAAGIEADYSEGPILVDAPTSDNGETVEELDFETKNPPQEKASGSRRRRR